jgi:hypothetical protein
MNEAVEYTRVLIGVTAIFAGLQQTISCGDTFAGEEIYSMWLEIDYRTLTLYNEDDEQIGHIVFPPNTEYIESYQRIAIDGPAETK